MNITVYLSKNSKIGEESVNMLNVYLLSIKKAIGGNENDIMINKKYVEENVDEAIENCIFFTPTIIIGKRRIIGMPSFEQFRTALEKEGIRQ